jgi:hypothetical protein
LLPLERAISAAKTSIRHGNSHEWEALIVGRPRRPYKVCINRRSHRREPDHPGEIHVQPGPTYYALTLDGARRKAQRMVERRNRRDRLDVPIARTVEVRAIAATTRSDASPLVR